MRSRLPQRSRRGLSAVEYALLTLVVAVALMVLLFMLVRPGGPFDRITPGMQRNVTAGIAADLNAVHPADVTACVDAVAEQYGQAGLDVCATAFQMGAFDHDSPFDFRLAAS